MRVRWAPSGCHGWLCAGQPPCVQGWVFALLSLAFCHHAPLAAWREGQPSKEGESPCLQSLRAEMELSPCCKQGRGFSPAPLAFCLLSASGQHDLLYTG